MKIIIKRNCRCKMGKKDLEHYKEEVKRIKEMNEPRNILKEIHNALGF